jgi:SAM-dependent methyltransferase
VGERSPGSLGLVVGIISEKTALDVCYSSRYYLDRVGALAAGAFRRVTRQKCAAYSVIKPFVADKVGLELGGPSPIFKKNRLIPVYNCCQRIDGCNFASRTIWGDTDDGAGFGHHFGRNYTAEACDLSVISSETYDFVLASHVLEHVANPLRALLEWKRVLKAGGALLVIVPDKRASFDHRRPYTSFEHLESDFKSNTSEADLSHLEEVLRLHDLRLDPAAGSPERFRERCLNNYSVRGMHHHVFSPEVLALMFNRVSMQILSIESEHSFHIVGFAQSANDTSSN